MKTSHLRTVLAILTLILQVQLAFSLPRSLPNDLKTIVGRSEIIVVGKLTKINSRLKNPKFYTSPDKLTNEYHDQFISFPGIYEFDVLMTLKGKTAKVIKASIPAVPTFAYGWASAPIEVGGWFIIFLKKTNLLRETNFVSTDLKMPFAILGKKYKPPLEKPSLKPSPIMDKICDLLLTTLDDKTVFLVNTHLLENVKNPKIVERLKPLIDDPDEKIQSNVLACLATNQYVEAIPRIADLHCKIVAEHGGGGCVDKLDGFVVKEALPYMNSLLFSPCDSVRFGAAYSLRKIADSTSIPYLIAGLADPDKINKFEYYFCLTKLLPQLGSQKDIDAFEANPEGICLVYRNWWRDELSGKHLQKTSPVSSEPGKQTLSTMNPLLFSPFSAVRLSVAKSLMIIGDSTSIPYLIAGLADPDKLARYECYACLTRLLPQLGALKGKDEFESSPQGICIAYQNWWRDELEAKHLQMP